MRGVEAERTVGGAGDPPSLPGAAAGTGSSVSLGLPHPAGATAAMTLPVVAFAFATTFRLKELASALSDESLHAEVILDKDCLVARLSPPSETGGPSRSRLRIAVLFDFGSVVLLGLDQTERERVIRAISARLSAEPHPPLTEDFLVEVRPGAAPAVQFDRVVLPEATLPSLQLISLLLAQSVAMDYYDEDVQEIQRRSDAITKSLQLEGRLPGRVGDLVKFIGSCIATKNGVIATLALFDKPDATWEDPQLDRLYNGLRLELEIDDRFRALEARLRMIQENLVLLVDLTHSRSTWRLELTVVLLIMLEVFLTLWQMFHGGGHA